MRKGRELYEKEFKDLGLMVGFYRRRSGLTQEQLADRAGISLGFLSQLEAPNVVAVPSLATIFALAKAMHISAYKLLMAPE